MTPKSPEAHRPALVGAELAREEARAFNIDVSRNIAFAGKPRSFGATALRLFIGF
jgi:hypothetical protein